MVISCWSVKGGVGTTVTAVALALTIARRNPLGGWLVDLGEPPGDIAGVLGMGDAGMEGVADWLAAGERSTPEALGRLAVPVVDGLSVVGPGSGYGDTPISRAQHLVAALAEQSLPVVVDCGRVDAAATQSANRDEVLGRAAMGAMLAAAASTSLLVLRPCYLGLRRAVESEIRPSGVVVVHEPGRALGPAEVEDVIGVPVVACVDVDPAVARVVDAGMLAARMPRHFAKAIGRAA